MGPLGRIAPPDREHETKYSLAAVPTPVDVPVVIGINWYDSFDNPTKLSDGSWHLPDVAKHESLGTIRGGHCVCLEPMGAPRHNTKAQQVFYDQKSEGACVGFGNSRALTIQRKSLFDAFWLYDACREYEGTYPEGEGSTVRAAAHVLLKTGHRIQTGNTVCTRGKGDTAPELQEGIKAVRWATGMDEVLTALARPGAHALPLVNSWGTGYPGLVWLPTATADRIIFKEGGEAGVFTHS